MHPQTHKAHTFVFLCPRPHVSGRLISTDTCKTSYKIQVACIRIHVNHRKSFFSPFLPRFMSLHIPTNWHSLLRPPESVFFLTLFSSLSEKPSLYVRIQKVKVIKLFGAFYLLVSRTLSFTGSNRAGDHHRQKTQDAGCLWGPLCPLLCLLGCGPS